MSEPDPVAVPRPLLRVIGGDATAEEIAAVVAVLAARGARAPQAPPRYGRNQIRAGWTDRRAALRTAVPVGPGAWVAFGRVPGARTKAAT